MRAQPLNKFYEVLLITRVESARLLSPGCFRDNKAVLYGARSGEPQDNGSSLNGERRVEKVGAPPCSSARFTVNTLDSYIHMNEPGQEIRDYRE